MTQTCEPTPYEKLTTLVSLHLDHLSQEDPDYQLSLEIADQMAQIVPGKDIETVLNEDDDSFRQRLFRLRPELEPDSEPELPLDDKLQATKRQRHLPQTRFLNNGRYHGFLIQEQPHGDGTMNFLNGNRYQGKWSYGTPHGYGTMNFQNGDRFHGLWFRGKPHGDGMTHYHDGTRHFGQYYEGVPHGSGTQYFNDFTILTGHFDHNKPVSGKMTWPNGNYVCFSRRNIAHLQHLYQGSIYLLNGEQYHGQIQFTSPTTVSREGFGKHYFPNGHTINGFWEKNQIQLNHPYTRRNNKKQDYSFDNTPPAPLLPSLPFATENTNWKTHLPISDIHRKLHRLLQPSEEIKKPIYDSPPLLSGLLLDTNFQVYPPKYTCHIYYDPQKETQQKILRSNDKLPIPSLLQKTYPPHFVVYIYQMPRNDSTTCETHMIEFQRRSGCCITFKHLFYHYKQLYTQCE